jgi:predicted nucleic acid-binding protein
VTAGPFVVDTNVVVAGLITRQPSAATARILDGMLSGELRFLLSEDLLAEYRSVLLRAKIVAAHGLTGEEVDEVLVRIAANGAVHEPGPAEIASSGPAGDPHLFALLAVEPAALLVSGDLQVLQHAGRRGRTPEAALEEPGER